MNNLPALLKKLRAEQGLTQDQVGEAVRISGSSIAAFETGRQIPQPDTSVRLDEVLNSGDQVQRASVDAREAARPGWFRAWAGAEERAATLRYHETSLVPGLLQTEEYARSVLDNGLRGLGEVEEKLAVRMERQAAILDRENPPTCAFTMDAAALRCGPPDVAKQQLEHLVDIGKRSNIFIHVIPESAGVHPGRSGSFALAMLDNGAVAGCLEDLLEGRTVTDAQTLIELDRLWHAISAVALPCDQSRDLILKMVNEL